MIDEIELEFTVETALYKRGMTRPLAVLASRWDAGFWPILRGVLIGVCVGLGIALLNYLLFPRTSAFPMLIGFFIGAATAYAAARLPHARLMKRHLRYNALAGQQKVRFSPKGVEIARKHTQSQVEWPVITGIHAIPGATLVDIETNRLILPDDALPGGMTPAAFADQLRQWQGAA